MSKTTWIAALSLAALGACSPEPAETPAAPLATEASASAPAMADMPMPASSPAIGPITSSGTIVTINATEGVVTLEHQAIPQVNWDAMTMAFTTTDPAILKDLKVGDKVAFDLVSAQPPTKISRIAKE